MRLLRLVTVFRNDRNGHQVGKEAGPLLLRLTISVVRISGASMLLRKQSCCARAFKKTCGFRNVEPSTVSSVLLRVGEVNGRPS